MGALLSWTLLAAVVAVIHAIDEPFDVKSYLLARPGRMLRPALTNGSVTVLLGLSLTNVEVDVSRSAVTVSGWLNIGWKNPALSWTSDNSVLKNIERTYLHMDQMWIPDMRPINMLDVAKSWFGKTVALVWRDGRAHLGLPVTISFRCKNTVTDDSDQFRCPITIGPWVHSVDEVDVQPASDTVDVSHIVASGAWRVARSSVVRREVTYACCPREFAMLDMELILRPQYC